MRSPWVVPLAIVLAGAVTTVGRAGPEDPPAAAPAAAAVTSADCMACHEPAATGMKHTSHAGLEKGCLSCHDAAAAAKHAQGQMEGQSVPGPSLNKAKAGEVTATCLQCHDKGKHASFTGSVHDRRNVSCASCHSVHSPQSATKQLKTARDSETCFTCHQSIRGKSLRTSHHPVREGQMSCATCHDVHDGASPKLIAATDVNEKCLECHTEKRGPHLWEHAPVRESCLNCHDPHGSNHDKMLVAKQPFLCQRCHLNTRHPGTLYDARNTLAGATVAALNSRSTEHACRNCHTNIHGSNSPSGPYLGR